MTTAIATAIVVLVTTLLTARPAAAEEPEPMLIPLRYGLKRALPLGIRLEVAPGLLVSKSAAGIKVIGYTGFVKVKAYADLLIFKSEVESFEDSRGATTRWSAGVHLGGELQPGQLIGHVVGGARSLARNVF